MDFANRKPFDLKATVAGDIGVYLDSTADSPEQEDALRWMSAGLSRILTDLLDGNKDWYRGCWFDGIIPVEMKVLTRDELYIEGIAIWEGHKRVRGVEPVELTITISDNRDTITKYIIKVGDARRGLVRVPIDLSYRRSRSAEWLFVFMYPPETDESAGRSNTSPIP
jgi:hypothetical protein